MTLIVGIIAKDAIVLAADSQTSYGGWKLPGTNKINIVEFTHLGIQKSILVAESGMVTLSNKVVDIIRDKASKTTLKDKETITNLVSDAMREVRRSQIELYPAKTFSLEEWKIHFRDTNPVELTVAFFWDFTPHLFTITLDECIVHWSKDYVASGCGDSLGNYLLKEHFREKLDYELAIAIAVKITSSAARYVEGCGSPIKAAALVRCGVPAAEVMGETVAKLTPPIGNYWSDTPVIFPPDRMDQLVSIIDKVESQMKDNHVKKLHQSIQKESRKYFELLMREFTKALPPS